MSFWFLAATVSIAVFGLTAMLTTLFTRAGVRVVSRSLEHAKPRTRANALFLLRTLPLPVAIFASVGLAFPAFLRFEPHMISETISLKLWLFAAGGGVLLTAILLRATRILRATSKAERFWINAAERLQWIAPGSRVPVFRLDVSSPVLIVTGFFRAKVFISSVVLEMLTPGELAAALAHEMAHVSFSDNLKQMLFGICTPPRWLEIESEKAAWVSASELAADDAALDRGASALDLAGALVKMARLKWEFAAADVAACQLLSDLPYSSLQARVAHLETAIANPYHPTRWPSRRYRLYFFALFAVPTLILLPYVNTLLGAVHELLELLVR